MAAMRIPVALPFGAKRPFLARICFEPRIPTSHLFEAYHIIPIPVLLDGVPSICPKCRER